MSGVQTYQEDFVLPAPPPREMILGGHNATLVEITRPQPSKEPNERGDHPLTSIFKWAIDTYEDMEPQWSYVNVDSRGERSNFYKVYKALTGQPLLPTTNVVAKELVGLRCQLLLEESATKVGYARVSGYLPIPKARQRPTPRVQEDIVVEQRPAPGPIPRPATNAEYEGTKPEYRYQAAKVVPDVDDMFSDDIDTDKVPF